MNACTTLLMGICCTYILLAQDLTSCGDGYTIDLSVGYTVTGQGLQSCGCAEETNYCELVHIVMREVQDGNTSLLSCPNISLTERWWRELKDLVDIYDPVTCQEYPESDTHPDRYEFNTADLNPGDTLSILVCKVSSFDRNIIELSASPTNECRVETCPPVIDCPAEFKLRKDFDCAYTIPDFLSGVTLTDICEDPAMDVTDDYTIMQLPPAGTTVTENLFVEMRVYDESGVLITTCDIYVSLAEDPAPVMGFPLDIADIEFGSELPDFELIPAHDTLQDGTTIAINVVTSIETGDIDPCAGYPMTYRWTATDTCGNTTTREKTFNILPDLKSPLFVSVPVDIDTILVGESFPLLVDLIAVNEDGSADGVTMTKSIDPYIENLCQGYPVTYRWTATDTCSNMAEITKSFYVKPVNEPPLFVSSPQAIPDITASEELPSPELIEATNAAGFNSGITVTHSIDPYEELPCEPYNITYRWTARDSCSNVSSITASFAVLPDTIDLSSIPAMDDMDIRIENSCEQLASITIPKVVGDYDNLDIDIFIFDNEWNLITTTPYVADQEYSFEAGTTHVVYQLSDACNRSMSDTITVNAVDVSPPTFECNPDQEFYISDFGTCSAVANWSAPLVIDNCPSVVTSQVSGPVPGSILSIGSYTIEYLAVDVHGNESSCSFDIVVSAIPASEFVCEPINASVDTSCQLTISRSFILSKLELSCINDLSIIIQANQDTLLGEEIDLTDHLQKNITYTVCDPLSGLCCSEDIIISDTIAPVLTCNEPMNTYCYNDIENYRPQVSDCSPVTWDISTQAVTDDCVDQNTQAIINKTYYATDESGNRSSACTQQFIIRYAKIDSLDDIGAISFPRDTTLQCDNIDLDNSIISNTGYPTINGVAVDPENPVCGLNISYADEIIYKNGCNKSIIRSWQIVEDRCHIDFAIVTGQQYIVITDTIAPTISPTQDTITIDTRVKECFGYLFQPSILLQDNCQEAQTLTVNYNYNNQNYDAFTPIPLPGGFNDVIVTVTDECGNKGRDTITIEVQDLIRPVAVCYDQNIITLSGGVGKLSYRSIDAGSYDNCDISSIDIRRKESYCIASDSVYSDYVHFCCEDIGKEILVSLRVIDNAGNINICHGYVLVQDKVSPTITCPPDLEISCEANISASENSNDPYGYLFGILSPDGDMSSIGIDPQFVINSSGPLVNGSITDECSNDLTYNVSTESNINNCGIGTISRIFTAQDQAGNLSRPCIQTITINAGEELDTMLITWPKSEVEISVCNSTYDISPEVIGKPKTQGKTCTLYGISHDDTYYDIPENTQGVCTKIIRSWTIINWCSPEDHRGITKYQTIKISDNEAPIINQVCDELLYLKSSSIDCQNIPITLTLDASDNCTPSEELDISVEVDLGKNGIRDYTSQNINIDSASIITWSDTLIGGDHKITWVIKDKCGNETRCIQQLLIEDTKPPTPYAHGLNMTLTTEPQVEIWASDLNVKASDPCGHEVETRIGFASGDFNDAFDNLTLTCDHIGETLVKVYAYRRLSDGTITSDFTTVTIDLYDNSKLCTNDNTSETAELKTNLGGRIKTSYGVSLPYTEVEISTDTESSILVTNDAGWFEQDNLDVNTYHLSPYLEDNHRAGLSTKDVIMLQRHILGLTTLTSPWDLLTADVTRNNIISASDIIELRKVLLGIDSEMDKRPAWLFLRSDYRFIDSRHAHEEIINYNTFFNPHDGNQRIDFTGMKLGDLDKSVTISNQSAKKRSTKVLELIHHSQGTNGTDTISITLTEDFQLYGYQLSLDIQNPENIQKIIVADNFDFDEHQDHQTLRISAHSPVAMDLKKGDPIVQIITTANSESQIEISTDRYLTSEIYDQLLNTYEVRIGEKRTKTIEPTIHVNPNPFTDNAFLSINSLVEEETKIVVMDSHGRQITSQVIKLETGANEIPLSTKGDLPKGILYYHVSSNTTSHVGRIVSL